MKRAHSDNDKAKRQESILTAALSEFSQNGVDATRMDDIAQTAGVSKGTLYLYFKSKDDLFSALINDYAGGLVNDAIATITAEPDSHKALRLFVNAMAQVLVEKQLAKIIPLLIANAHRKPQAVSDYQHSIIDAGLPLISRLLDKGVKAGIFRAHNSDQYATLVIAPAVQMVIFHTLFAKDKLLQQDAIAAQLNLQLDMLFAHLEVSHD